MDNLDFNRISINLDNDVLKAFIQVKEFIKIVDDRSTKLNFVYKLKLKDDFTDFYSEYTLFSTLCNINNLINFEEKVTFFSEKYSDSDLKKFSVRLIC